MVAQGIYYYYLKFTAHSRIGWKKATERAHRSTKKDNGI